jgi:hypothetical protein
MKPEALAAAIEKLIVDTTDDYAKVAIEVQEAIYSRLLRTLKGLELDNEGYILQSSANRKILGQAEEIVNDQLPGTKFTKSVSESIGAVPKIDTLNNSYFSSISDAFKENRNFIKSIQSQTVASIEQNLLQDGLKIQVKTPITDILNRNINSGGQFKGFLDELRTYITGDNKVEGRILSYSRGYLKDALIQYSRTYQQAMTADLKLEFYLYSGGLIDTSRPFCVERAGKYFHHKEIESWAGLNWSGKIPTTTESSIFVFVAGYGCQHELIPVSRIIVPEDVIQRALDAGYIKN